MRVKRIKMHKSMMIGTGIFLALITILLSVSISMNANAQIILTENSNTTLSTVAYQLNISELNLSNTFQQWYDNETNFTHRVNITNIVTYTCMLNIGSGNYFHSGSTKNLSGVTNIVHELSIPLIDGQYISTLNCLYSINSTNTTDNVTYNDVNVVSTMIQKILIIDTTKPNISIYNTSVVLKDDIAHVMLGLNDISTLNCSLSSQDIISQIQQIYFSSNLTYATNDANVSIPLNITEGNYTLNVTCADEFNNIQTIQSPLYVLADIDEIPSITLNLSKPTFSLGEIGYYTLSANNNSNVSITICPIASGWVQCYMTPTFINETFPKTQALPYTNKTGMYLMEGVMRYKNYTITTNATYETVNTLIASITVSKSNAGVGDTIIFNATALSGIGSYTYKWTMHDGATIIGSGAYKIYNTAGTFTVNLSVTDSVGNMYNTSTAVTVKNYYTLNVVVADEKDKKRLSDVTVEINDESKQTDASGTTSFKLLENNYKVHASKENYEVYAEKIDLNAARTLYINMSFLDLTPPVMTLLTDNDKVMSKDTVDLKFKAEDITNVACSLYVADINTSWYQLKDSGDNLLTNTEYTFELRDLSNGVYKWKIGCSDLEDNEAYSEERKFVVSDGEVTLALKSKDEDYDYISNALDNMNKLSGDESEVADILSIRIDLKDLLDRINTLERDVHDLAYRRDLDDAGKKEAQDNITRKIEIMKESIPVGLEIQDSKTFVKYVHDEDLKVLLEEYSSLKNMDINTKLFMESTKLAQSKVVVSTHVRNVELYYLDGNIKDITLVTKEIQAAKPDEESLIRNSNSITFVEVIPKSICQTARQLNMITKGYTVLKDDPLIEYPSKTEVITYYINATLPLSDFENTDTVLIEKNVGSMKMTTGFSIFGVESLSNISDIDVSNINLNGQSIMIILIVLLILFYIIVNFDIIDKIRNITGGRIGFGSKKKISFIRVLVNDASDYLKTEDYDKAALIYREIKLSYERANYFVKKQIYDESFELCNQLDLSYALKTLEKIEYYIHISDRNKALLEFEKLDNTYNKLSDKYQSQIADQFKKTVEMIKAIEKT
jgi:hypothetical protein